MSPLLNEIEAFLTAHKMSRSRFGAEAIGDKNFIREISAGGRWGKRRRVFPETEQRVRLFMLTYRDPA